MKIRSRRPVRNPRPFAPLGERCPGLAALRDLLTAQIVICDDLPADYVRALYNMSGDQKVWSRAYALRRGDR